MGETLRRRDLIRSSVGLVLAGTLAGCVASGGNETASTETTTRTTTTTRSFDYGSWFEDVDSFSGTRDLTGRSEAVIDVGTPGNGGNYAYSPTAIHVDPGTHVEFRWDSDGHNVVVEAKPNGSTWQGHPLYKEQLGVAEHTFEIEGTYKYYCGRHRDRGMKGAIVVGEP